MDIAKSQRPGSGLRHARHLVECGKLPPTGLLDAVVARSWQRSIDAGLVPFGRPAEPDLLTSGPLAQVIERRRSLLTRARPVMDYLHAQTRGSGCMVILADDQGILLEALGDADFVSRAERVTLMPGASWHERHRGTNAIGTALAEAAPVAVHGGEHFLEHNGFLTCAAAPLIGPDGRLLGVLDISGHRRSRQTHTAGLVRAAAHMIENRLFDSHHDGDTRLHFHPQADGIGTVAEGLAAVTEDGRIIGANRAGMALFGLEAADLGRTTLERVLRLRLAELLSWGQSRPGAVMATTRVDGQTLFLRVDSARRRASARPVELPARSAIADPLSALDTGDARLSQMIGRARKVLDKPIPLVLHGESGVGKEVFAKAVHASGPRRRAAFVAVNCAALPEHLIEAELFGYAPGAFTGARREGSPGRIREANGGTLFLDEIGDMPLALQCRLLRVLQDRQVSPLGGGKVEAVDFALITATHRLLKTEIDAGRFRADLYYRLNGLTLSLPPLRERSDFTTLVGRLVDGIAPAAGIALGAEVAAAFAGYHWPGNLRQLANTLRTACAMLDPGESRIDWHHLPDDLVEDLGSSPPPRLDLTAPGTLRQASDSLIGHTVATSRGNLSEAARRLGVSRNTLYRRLRRGSPALPQ